MVLHDEILAVNSSRPRDTSAAAAEGVMPASSDSQRARSSAPARPSQ